MGVLDLIPGGRLVQALVVAALVAAVIGGVTWAVHTYNDGLRDDGRHEVQQKWDAAVRLQQEVDLATAESKAKESKRRLEAQKENQDAQNTELATAVAAADRNARDAQRVRRDHETASEQWARRLADSPTRADLEAAGASIVLLTELLGRADKRAGDLATFADTSRARGLKCERDYDALSLPAGASP